MSSTVLPAHHTLLDAFAAYEHAVDGLARPTVRNHRTYFEALLRWWEREHPQRPAPAGTTADLIGFLVAESARGLSARTRKAEVAAPHTGLYSAAEVQAILAHTAGLADLRGRQRRAVVATLRHRHALG